MKTKFYKHEEELEKRSKLLLFIKLNKEETEISIGQTASNAKDWNKNFISEYFAPIIDEFLEA